LGVEEKRQEEATEKDERLRKKFKRLCLKLI
jgi:hypothetical protein